jgi:hypothetical protein
LHGSQRLDAFASPRATANTRFGMNASPELIDDTP